MGESLTGKHILDLQCILLNKHHREFGIYRKIILNLKDDRVSAEFNYSLRSLLYKQVFM